MLFKLDPATKEQLWHFSAVQLAVAIPFFALGKGAFYFACVLGILTGFLAMHGNSLRSSVNMLRHNTIAWLVLAFLAIATVSAITSSYPETIHKAIGLWPMVLACCALFVVLREMPQRVAIELPRYMLWASVAAGAFVTLDVLDPTGLLSQWRFHPSLHDNPYRWHTFTSLLAIVLPIVGAWVLHQQRQLSVFYRQYGNRILAFLIFALFLSGGRSGIFGLFVAGCFMLFFLKRYQNTWPPRQLVAYSGIGALAALGIYMLKYGHDFWFGRMMLKANEHGLGGGRTGIWEKSWELFTTNMHTLFLGIGPKGMAFASEGAEGFRHAHNFVLQALSETGLAGTACLLAGILLLALSFMHFAKRSLLGVGALGSFVTILVAGQFNFSLFDFVWLASAVVVLMVGWRCGWTPLGQQKHLKLMRSQVRKPHHLRVVKKPTVH